MTSECYLVFLSMNTFAVVDMDRARACAGATLARLRDENIAARAQKRNGPTEELAAHD